MHYIQEEENRMNEEPTTFEQYLPPCSDGLTPEERAESWALTGAGPEADFAKLVARGCVQGWPEDPAGWREGIRRCARKAKVKIETHSHEGMVVASTQAYQEFLMKRSTGQEGEVE